MKVQSTRLDGHAQFDDTAHDGEVPVMARSSRENAVGVLGIPVGVACELPFVVERLIKDRAVRTDQAQRIPAQLRSSALADGVVG